MTSGHAGTAISMALGACLGDQLDGNDRRFDARELEMLAGPENRDGSAWIRWRVTYRVEGAPPLVMEGEETATFEGDRIRRLEDRYEAEMKQRISSYLKEHGEKLGISMVG